VYWSLTWPRRKRAKALTAIRRTRRCREVKLTPLDIRRQEFKRVVRGVDPEEVSVFLDMVAGEYERILRESKSLSEERDELKRKVDELESMREAIQGAVVMAKKSSDELLNQAKKEAELRLKEAEVEAERILEDARRQVALFRREIDEIRNQRAILVGRLKSLLDGQMKMLEAYVGDWELDERSLRPGQGQETPQAPDAGRVAEAVPEPEEETFRESETQARGATVHPEPVVGPQPPEEPVRQARRERLAPQWPEDVSPSSQEPEQGRPGFLRPPRPTLDREILRGGDARRPAAPEPERGRRQSAFAERTGREPDEGE